MPVSSSSSRSIKLSCSGVWKIFGQGAEKLAADAAFQALSIGDKRALLDEKNMIVGAEDVSFSVREGELFVIMGLSGSGKSTMLRCIAQLQRPSLGEVVLDGERLDTMSDADLREIRRRKMGMVFQHFGLVPHFTALENIAFPLKIRGENKRDSFAKAEEMLNLVGLEGRGSAYPAELSGGQQQRVGIARSLAVDPQVWLLDEPFSALDPLIRTQLQDELLELQARLRKTIVFITHDFAEAVKLADRIAIMRDGRIVQEGSPADLLLTPADDYVASFVADVPRLQVLRLSDIMTKGGGSPAAAVKMDHHLTLGECLIQLPQDASTIAVMDREGNVCGTCDRDHLLASAAGEI